jgi:hypothetical protein
MWSLSICEQRHAYSHRQAELRIGARVMRTEEGEDRHFLEKREQEAPRKVRQKLREKFLHDIRENDFDYTAATVKPVNRLRAAVSSRNFMKLLPLKDFF